MATYNITDSVAGAMPSHLSMDKFVCYKVALDAATLIAGDATLTTNAKITAGDIFQVIDVPVGFVFLGSAFVTVTPEGAAETADIGIAGGDEIQDGVSTNNTAGLAALTLVTDDWGANNVMGYYFATADTIDVKFVNDTTTGSWILYVWGVLCV